MTPNAPRCLCLVHRSRAVSLCSSNEDGPGGVPGAVPGSTVKWHGQTIAGPFQHMSGAEEWLRQQPIDPVCLQPFAPPTLPPGYDPAAYDRLGKSRTVPRKAKAKKRDP